MSDIEDRVHAIECKVSELGVLTKRAMDAIQTLEDCQLVRLSPKQPEPALERYRMTRPTNRDALVIDGGKVWRPVFGPDGMWEADDDSDSVAWEVLTDPKPFQNCTLTADDPEPPIESVVLDCEGDPWKRSSLEHEWCGVEGDDELPWRDLCYQLPPVTLLYRGEA